MEYLKNRFLLYGVIVILLITNIGTFLYFLTQKEECVCNNELVAIESENKEVEIEDKKIKVDIKGYIKNPGVYELREEAIINDLIKLAGGVKKNGTTDNINLSKKLKDEDMIIVLSKSELKKQKSATKINTSTTTSQSNASSVESNNTIATEATAETKISINNATQEELMTLSGIGEKTAIKIIEYRTQNSFNTIEDIKNVSGIGDALFEKIKDYITI